MLRRLDRALTRRALAKAALVAGPGIASLRSPRLVAAGATPVAVRRAGLPEIVARIDQMAAQAMARGLTPGLALAISDKQGLLATREYGYADLVARRPVTPDTLFAFGSIGKSFTAACLLQLSEEGRVDLHAPVTDYLPWFAVRSPYGPITLHHLLTHTAGIVAGTLFSPDPRYEVWALRSTSVGSPPGAVFWYSNDGYETLGLVIEAVTGRPYGDVVQERLFAPLGMRNSAKALTNDIRPRAAVGHVPALDDRPVLPRHGVTPAPWLESNAGDGSLAATAADLAAWLRMLLNEGAGPNGPVLSPESFAKMRGGYVTSDEIAPYRYGYGLLSGEYAGQTVLAHAGEVLGFEAQLEGCLEAGVGVVALANGPESPAPIAHEVLTLLVAAYTGRPLPAAEPPADPTLVPNAPDYAGTYRGAGQTLRVTADGGRLRLDVGAESIVLVPHGDDAFLADHPDFALFPVRFGRDDRSAVVELAHGPDWYANERYLGPTTFASPPEWDAYVGHYRAFYPYPSNFRIVVRKGVLVRIEPTGEESVLVPEGSGFRVGEEPHSPERMSFDTVIGGKALRALVNGSAEYPRFFTP